MARKIIIGAKYGRLTVIEQIESHRYPSGSYRRKYRCICDCGNENKVLSNALGKSVSSCGCIHREHAASLKYSHGEAGSRLNSIWSGIKQRINNPKADYYHCYGGKGIKICKEWSDSFIAFRDWANSNGYNDTLTIERIDINKDYCPENCKWIPPKEQANNRSTNIRIGICGEFKTLGQWIKALCCSETKARQRFRMTGNVFYALELE